MQERWVRQLRALEWRIACLVIDLGVQLTRRGPIDLNGKLDSKVVFGQFSNVYFWTLTYTLFFLFLTYSLLLTTCS